LSVYRIQEYHQSHPVDTLPSFGCHLDMNPANPALYTADKVGLQGQPRLKETYHHHKLNALFDNFDRLRVS
jgi:hypothetical protein